MSQLALFPMKHLNVTQRYGIGTHVGSYAVDLAGKDALIDNVYAPFNCVVKKIWNNGNNVWFQSLTPVLCADGSTSTVTVMMTHDNSISDMYVGRYFKQGEVIYQEGTAGNASGNHVHLEASKSPFGGEGWHQNTAGYWVINNGVKPEAIFALKDVVVINAGGLAWKEEDMTIGNKNHAILLLKQFTTLDPPDASWAGIWANKTLEDFLNKYAPNRVNVDALVAENKTLKADVKTLSPGKYLVQ